MISPAQIVDEARTWIGVPFLHQGRSRHGVDCLGLVLCVRSALGPFPEAENAPVTYRRAPPGGQMLATIMQTCEPALEDEPGSVILFQWPKAPDPTHVAICTGPTIIHAYATQKTVLEVGYRGPWARFYHSAWRLPGVTYE